MNYIKEMNSFMDWLEINPLDATTQTLWFHIMAIANKSGWPEWFTIANLTLMAKVGISENTLIKHRNILIQKGRIEYKNQGKQKAGRYKILSLTSNIEVKTEVTKVDTSNNEVSHEVNLEVKREVNLEVKPSALYKLNKTKLDLNTSTNTENEVLKFDDEFSELAKLHQRLGFEYDGFTPNWIEDSKEKYGIEWVKNAMIEASNQGARNRAYVNKILNNWKSWGGMKLSTDKNSNNQPKVVAAKKTRFHNFEQRTDKYTSDELEAAAKRKRDSYLKRLKGEEQSV